MMDQVVSYRGNVKSFKDLKSKDFKKQNGDIYHVIDRGRQYLYKENKWIDIHDMIYNY